MKEKQICKKKTSKKTEQIGKEKTWFGCITKPTPKKWSSTSRCHKLDNAQVHSNTWCLWSWMCWPFRGNNRTEINLLNWSFWVIFLACGLSSPLPGPLEAAHITHYEWRNTPISRQLAEKKKTNILITQIGSSGWPSIEKRCERAFTPLLSMSSWVTAQFVAAIQRRTDLFGHSGRVWVWCMRLYNKSFSFALIFVHFLPLILLCQSTFRDCHPKTHSSINKAHTDTKF